MDDRRKRYLAGEFVCHKSNCSLALARFHREVRIRTYRIKSPSRSQWQLVHGTAVSWLSSSVNRAVVSAIYVGLRVFLRAIGGAGPRTCQSCLESAAILIAEMDQSAVSQAHEKVFSSSANPMPPVIHVNKNATYPAAVEALKADGTLPRRIPRRQCKFLGHVIELSFLCSTLRKPHPL
jgi:hypothetical protein